MHEMEVEEDVQWPTDKPGFENQCAICEKTIGAQVTDLHARWVIHNQVSGWASWMKVCGKCQNEQWRRMNKSYDHGKPGVIRPSHLLWQEEIFDMLKNKACTKYEAKPWLMDTRRFEVGPPCSSPYDDDSEVEEAVATPVPDDMSL